MLPTPSFFVSKVEGRKRLLVKLENGGKEGWGEASPLPGWSHETYESIAQQALTLDLVSPSLSFAFTSAWANLHNPYEKATLPIAYYLNGTPEEIAEKAEEAIRLGYKTAKIKISHLSMGTARNLLETYRNHLRLRIDLNRAWSLEQALSFFAPFPQDAFDYIEEPLQNPHQLPLFSHPFAIDESLREGFFTNHPLLKALIIKPTLHSNWIRWLHSGKQIILGSSHETDLGHAHIALLAKRLNLIHLPLGLGTALSLQETLLRDPLSFSRGYIHLPPQLRLKEEKIIRPLAKLLKSEGVP